MNDLFQKAVNPDIQNAFENDINLLWTAVNPDKHIKWVDEEPDFKQVGFLQKGYRLNQSLPALTMFVQAKTDGGKSQPLVVPLGINAVEPINIGEMTGEFDKEIYVANEPQKKGTLAGLLQNLEMPPESKFVQAIAFVPVSEKYITLVQPTLSAGRDSNDVSALFKSHHNLPVIGNEYIPVAHLTGYHHAGSMDILRRSIPIRENQIQSMNAEMKPVEIVATPIRGSAYEVTGAPGGANEIYIISRRVYTQAEQEARKPSFYSSAASDIIYNDWSFNTRMKGAGGSHLGGSASKPKVSEQAAELKDITLEKGNETGRKIGENKEPYTLVPQPDQSYVIKVSIFGIKNTDVPVFKNRLNELAQTYFVN